MSTPTHLIDQIEHFGAQAEAGTVAEEHAAFMLQQFSDGGLTRAGSRHLIQTWRTIKARYEQEFERTTAQLLN